MRLDLLPITFEGKLDRFIEESSEAIKAICKLRRFGERPIDYATGIKYDNLKDLLQELKDVEHSISELREHLNARAR